MNFDFFKEPGLKLWDRNLVTDGRPLISIITAFYNSGKYFQQTFNCVMNQTFPWFEWIIVDDGTTDQASLLILDQLSKQDSRIRIIHQSNAGPSSARNTGIDSATTDYIFPLDSDDLIEPTCLEYEYWALYYNPKATWAYSDSVGFQGEEYLWELNFDPEKMKRENHLTATALIRKQAALDVGKYTVQNFPFNEDWHFWLKLLARGAYPVQIKGEYLFWYRRGQTGVLASVNKNEENKKKNQKLIEEAASFVINPEKPIIYPVSSWKDYENLKVSEWNQNIYTTHEKIHILFLLPWLVMGGADKFNLDLITGLDKNRYEISIITTSQSDNTWLQCFREITPEIFNLPNFLSPNDYPEFIDYFIKSREIDILFLSNSNHGYCLLPWIRQHFPKLAIVDYVHMEEWYWKNGGHARSSGIMASILERTYVCNNATRDVMINYFQRSPESVETVHIGIDEKLFDPEKVRKGLLYRELNIESSRPIVLFICRLHHQKRPFLMLKIAQYVRKQKRDVAFVVIGDGPLEKDLMSEAKAMDLENTVYFLGARNEVRPYYQDAKVTLICSMKEGLSLTAYESCAMGVPVVSADVGGQKDLIDNSVGALIPCLQDEEKDFGKRNFPIQEIENYGNAILSLLSDEEHWKSLSNHCRKKIEDAFTIDAMIKWFDREFQRLVGSKELYIQREQVFSVMRNFGLLFGELYTLNLVAENVQQFNPFGFDSPMTYIEDREILARLAECEKVVNRHEEVVNRHEEVVNRHEKSINHQWEIQKWHEERLQALEKQTPLLRRALYKFLKK